MGPEALHRFEIGGLHYVIDTETCFCFECDDISWNVLQHYPREPVNRILSLLEDRFDRGELEEVIGELEWLRTSKSILPAPKHEEMQKQYEVERGLHTMTVLLPPATEDLSRPGGPPRRAADLLFARAQQQPELRFELFAPDGLDNAPGLAELVRHVLDTARLAGKRATVAVRTPPAPGARLPKALRPHTLWLELELSGEAPPRTAEDWLAKDRAKLARCAGVFGGDTPGVSGRAVLRPAATDFTAAVKELEHAGFHSIALDLDGAYTAQPGTPPETLHGALRETAEYYAGRLLERRYFRLDPIAELFWRIYNGQALRRADPAGVQALAVDTDGAVYPAAEFAGQEAFHAGSLSEGQLDTAALKRFEDVGALTTQECMRCWARYLCGGGAAHVHQALSGSFRKPHAPWCDAQRACIEHAVAAFNKLSSRGIEFTRVYHSLGRAAKPSLFQLARAAMRGVLLLRPLEEADAAMLARWENWNDAAYFTFTESGMLMATRYDREMDALHPHLGAQEFVITRRDGAAIGLLRVRPELAPDTATVWVYLANEEDCASDSVRRGFRELLNQARAHLPASRLLVPVGPRETALAAFLEACGFNAVGDLREALFLNGAYHDIRIFHLSLC